MAMWKYGAAGSVAGLALAAMGFAPAQAVTMKECSAQYQAAKTAGSLNGQSWNDYRKGQCGAGAGADASTAGPSAAPAALIPVKAQPVAKNAPAAQSSAPAAQSSAPSSKSAHAAAPASAGNAVFPSAISPKYSQEAPGLARRNTCLDQYRANKASNGNGGLNWIQKGGGYYSECTKRLKGA